jgi:hypothetical protein
MKVLSLFLCLVFSLSGYSIVQLSLDDIPAIPGSQLQDSYFQGPENLLAEFRIFLSPKATLRQIADHGGYSADQCVGIMEQSGWQLRQENRTTRGGEFTFSKDIIKEVKLSVGPGASAIGGKMVPYVFLKFHLKRLIPLADIVGIDPPHVPRFPGSVRVRWMHLLGDLSLKYLAVGTVSQVTDYFQEELPGRGWQLAKGAATLHYTRPDARLSLHIKQKEGIVEIGVGMSGPLTRRQKSEKPIFTPPKQLPPPAKKPLTHVDIQKELPPYPGLTMVRQSQLPVTTAGEEIVKQFYEKPDTPLTESLDMASFYSRHLQEGGWQLLDEQWHGFGRKFNFQKGAVRLRIIIKAVGRLSAAQKAPRVPIPMEVTVVFPMPRRDIAGDDIEGVPRFPGSVRFYTLKAGIDHIVKYKAAASVEEVEWFFIENLTKKGWRFAGNDHTGLLFTPGATPDSPAEAFSKGKLIPTTLKLKVDDRYDGTVKIGLDLTHGDT